HCGTPRPADETLCPQCGKPWIDVRIAAPTPATPNPAAVDTTAVGPTAAAAALSTPNPEGQPPLVPIHDTGEFGMDDWSLPPDPPKRRTVWLLPIALLVAVAAFWSFVYFGGQSATTTTLAAVPSTTSSTSTTTTVPIALGEPSTTTSSTTTTTTVPYPSAESWVASGEDLSSIDLGLAAAGIGPLLFGDSLEAVAGQLVTTLGQAESAGDSGLCQPDEAYWLQWGPLKAIFDGYGPDASFVSYRYEESEDGSANVILRTLSGLELGQTVSQLQATYTQFTITFELIDGRDHFRLASGGDLLLWGPVSSTDATGTVLGIYSPTPCPPA
ncbi:MAG: hypothetical protein O3B42_07950, partial [Actinomycetota bacterium]|nr:hypothetical protein [Actinomycetota bacterium]